MKEFNTDLILIEDTTFDESIKVNGNISGKNGMRYNLIVKGNINAWNINASNIDAENIDAVDIDARNIDARNIYAGDINALNIDARGIDYYAVCFAYNNIKCKSINGERANSKHFCLDGKITIKYEKKFCDKCGSEIKGENKE